MRKYSLIVLICIIVLTGCGVNADGKLDKIVLADAQWNSLQIHNEIASTIIEEGYGIETEEMTGSTTATIQGLREGNIHVYMEFWTDNFADLYEKAMEAGDIEVVSVNFDDNKQGLYVPTYVIEGDEERGISPMAPDLKTVEDLKKYPDVFEDPEDPGKGRVISSPSAWEEVDTAISAKFDHYGLDETFNKFLPGSDAAIATSLAGAYEKGKAWVGYYWEPTAVTAKYDLTLLEEPEYDEAEWKETKGTEFPPNDVVVAVHKDFREKALEVAEFLDHYETSSELTEEALKYMDENDATAEETAAWWMKQHADVWTSWLPEDISSKVQEALNIN
ncbi:hypothetical protein JNUCC1_00458 [Lentibacillus sp. JNUCC-1]|uniref:ABC transporter substrate-binding protein n=1 Tax=Lentibacillus sp. JNUCC-1 TaxID=2654513 RepID=UPI0012E83F79|nr:ABC transporter substrate-binding protein [Lentibacillus sp. JNUCC-1]MUV36655.1 hypothetical protein [Lentibacillus sp. JNUCC-1]